MWKWIKSWWETKPVETPSITYPEVQIKVKFNHATQQDDVYIDCDWPKSLSSERIFDIYSKLLFAIQSGNMYNIFNDALLRKLKSDNKIELYNKIILQITEYTANFQTQLNTNPEGVLMYPSEVFKMTTMNEQ